MSGFWKKGYYILCFIVRTLYNLLSLPVGGINLVHT